MRHKSTERLLKYLQSNSNKNAIILDLGCGNGWFAAKLAKLDIGKVVGWDINKVELEQAQRVFSMPNLHFYYQDIFEKTIEQKFDFIIVNSVLQYFPEPSNLINRLIELLNDFGEIHILDSPFYKEKEVEAARERSMAYYQKLGMPKMADFYFHHTLKSLGSIQYDIMYNPYQWHKKLIRKLGILDSPFLWLRMAKT